MAGFVGRVPEFPFISVFEFLLDLDKAIAAKYRFATDYFIGEKPRPVNEFTSNYKLDSTMTGLARYSTDPSSVHAYPGERPNGGFCIGWPGLENDPTVYPIYVCSLGEGEISLIISDGRRLYDYNELRENAGLPPLVATFALLAYGANISPVKQALVDGGHWLTVLGWLVGFDAAWSAFPSAGNAISVLQKDSNCKVQVAINLVTQEQKDKMDMSEGDTYQAVVVDVLIPGLGLCKSQVYAGQGSTYAIDGKSVPVAGLKRQYKDPSKSISPMTSEEVVSNMLKNKRFLDILLKSDEFILAFNESGCEGYLSKDSKESRKFLNPVSFAWAIRHLRFGEPDIFVRLRDELLKVIETKPIEGIEFPTGTPEGLATVPFSHIVRAVFPSSPLIKPYGL